MLKWKCRFFSTFPPKNIFHVCLLKSWENLADTFTCRAKHPKLHLLWGRYKLTHFWCASVVNHSSHRSPSPGPNHVATGGGSNAPTSASATPISSTSRPSCSFTPSLAAHFNENLIKHVQGWPAEHAEKQVCPSCPNIIIKFDVRMSLFWCTEKDSRECGEVSSRSTDSQILQIFLEAFSVSSRLGSPNYDHLCSLCICQTTCVPGVTITRRDSHDGQHLHVWELHWAQKPAFVGPSQRNTSHIARTKVRVL